MVHSHVSVFKARYDLIVWVCVYIWVFDRALRVLRTLAFNIRFWNTKARATYDKDAHIVRLSIPCATSLYRPRPGTFYYLHLLDDVRFWESHPFTVSSIRNPRALDVEMDAREGSEESGEETSLLSSDAKKHDRHDSGPTMNFLIRPYDSSTRRLAQAAAAAITSRPRPASLRVIVEGPYGHTQPLDRFGSLLFVVGGSGIVVPLSHLEPLLLAERAANVASSRTRRPRRIRIVWAVREAAFASSVLREDFRHLYSYDGDSDGDGDGDSLLLSLEVYVTAGGGGGGGGAEGPSPFQVDGLQQPLSAKGFRVLYGRPDIGAEVRDAARELGARERLAVVACGPAMMADDARKAVVDVLGRDRSPSSSIEYFEESFNW